MFAGSNMAMDLPGKFRFYDGHAGGQAGVHTMILGRVPVYTRNMFQQSGIGAG